jgi:hypothetical protein
VGGADWTLRPTTFEDRDFLFARHRAAMRPYVDVTWGWDDAEQLRLFSGNFNPASYELTQLDGVDAGMLAVGESDEEIWRGSIEIHPSLSGSRSRHRRYSVIAESSCSRRKAGCAARP